MKHVFLILISTIFLSSCDVLSNMGVPLTQADIANGIKEALIQGVNRGGSSLFATQQNGNSALLNELLPPNVASILNTAHSLGLSPKINQFTTTLNNAAVHSAQKAIPVFINGIRSMNFADAMNILRGQQNAATTFLRNTTGNALVSAIRPEVNNVFTSFGLKPTLLGNLGSKSPLLSGLDVDITGLLTSLVCNKMFQKIEQEEALVRTQISARTTPLMQRVFGSLSQAVNQPRNTTVPNRF